MSTVFVLGAGASYGDELIPADESTWTSRYFDNHRHCNIKDAPKPPLITGFFDKRFMWDNPKTVIDQHPELVKYICRRWGIYDDFGSDKWTSLNLETVITSLAIDNEFSSPETEEFAENQLLFIDLKRYIQSILAHATICRYGRFTRILAERLDREDSVVSFNYDLLLDDELLSRSAPQYINLWERVVGKPLPESNARGYIGNGIYLKMHGSLNWFTCTNPTCRRADEIEILPRDRSLYVAGKSAFPRCETCNGQISNVLAPPLLHKQILQARMLRGIWGAAYKILKSARCIVIIGYSFPPTDFYTEWLFRKAVDHGEDTKVWIVNPENEEENYHKRISTIFRAGFVTTYKRFDQIEELLETMHQNQPSEKP